MASPIVLVDPDPAWPVAYATLAERIRGALGPNAVTLEHVGSTSVPGLAAKPIIDVLLLVPDSTAEEDYVPALESAGFAFHLREPDWFEHRLLKGTDIAANLHVFSVGCEEADRMLAFRDHLRVDPVDRGLYETTKRRLAAQEWQTVQDYADAKTDVVRAILTRSQI
jgi:GrpB-like predicted nucleotidyltransferase (UPF0157 family)